MRSAEGWRCAIAYLLKNGCRIPKKPENAKKFTNRRRKAEIKVNRLIKKLNGKAPQGRDLTGQKWLDMLLTATTKVPKDEAEAKSWQDVLLTKAKSVPYPIAYESNEDLTWIKNEKGKGLSPESNSGACKLRRLCVKFTGLGEFTFQIYCDKRQLAIFQRFYEDQQVKKASKNNHSSALFTLRSARIAWQEGKGKDKDKPWNINRLMLFCTFDTLLLTQEGTELVRQEKAEAITQCLALRDRQNPNQNERKRRSKSKTASIY